MIELYITKGAFNSLRVSVKKDGRQLSTAHAEMPAALRSLLRSNQSHRSVEEALVFIFESHQWQGDVHIDLPEISGCCQWSGKDVSRVLAVRCDGNRVQLKIEMACDGTVIPNQVALGRRLIIDTTTNCIYHIQNDNHDAAWPTILDHMIAVDEATYELPLAEWEVRYPLIASELSRGFCAGTIQFDPIEGQCVPKSDVSYSVNYSPSFYETDWKFSVVGSAGGLELPSSNVLSSLIWLSALKGQPIPDSVAEALNARQKQMIEAVLSGTPLSENNASFSSEIIDTVLTPLQNLLTHPFYYFVFNSGRWTRIEADFAKEAQCLLKMTPSKISVSELSKLADGQKKVTNLGQELTDLADLNVPIRYNNSDVELVHWNMSLKIDKNDDWFEIHPEITVDGRAVSDAEILEQISSSGIIEKDGKAYVLDANDLQILQLLWERVPDVPGTRKQLPAAIKINKHHLIDWIQFQRLGMDVSMPPDEEAVLKKLMDFEKIDPIEVPQSLNADLRQYQIVGYQWLAFLFAHQLGGILADDMGLGKTVQALTLIQAVSDGTVTNGKETPATCLVVVPPSLKFNWIQEVERFCPNLSVEEFKPESFDPSNLPDIVLVSYEMVRRNISVFQKINFKLICLDEAQLIKNITSERAKAIRSLNGEFKFCLTGTPLENHLGEFYSLVDFVLPGIFDSYTSFQAMIKQSQELRLLKRAKPFVMRRRKETILKELPAKIESDIYLDPSKEQKALYTKIIEQVKKSVQSAKKSQASIMAITGLLRLRQICIAPQLIQPEASVMSPKVEYLLEKVKELQDEGHSVLIFSQFRSFLNLLGGQLTENGIGYFQLDGKTPMGKRKKIIESFQSSPNPEVFLVSLKAGGVGLNLTKASYVLLVDPWWNPAVEEQAAGRSHRIGQTQKVVVVRLLIRHTIEEKMMALKDRKKALFKSIESLSQAGESHVLSREDLDYLLSGWSE